MTSLEKRLKQIETSIVLEEDKLNKLKEELKKLVNVKEKNNLFKELNITPKNKTLYETAFNTKSNRKLEFLGDRVVALVASETLYNTYDKFDGKLFNDKFVSWTRGTNEISTAKKLNLQKYIFCDGNMGKYVLENTYEALVGAIYLDLGLKKAKDFVYKTLLGGE